MGWSDRRRGREEGITLPHRSTNDDDQPQIGDPDNLRTQKKGERERGWRGNGQMANRTEQKKTHFWERKSDLIPLLPIF